MSLTRPATLRNALVGAGVAGAGLIAFLASLQDAKTFVCSFELTRSKCEVWGWVEPRSAEAGAEEPLIPVSVGASTAVADFVFVDSHIRLISQSELDTLSLARLRIARNEIFARRGRRFASPDLHAHFSQFSWYRPQYDEVALSSIEAANVQRFRNEELSRAGGMQ